MALQTFGPNLIVSGGGKLSTDICKKITLPVPVKLRVQLAAKLTICIINGASIKHGVSGELCAIQRASHQPLVFLRQTLKHLHCQRHISVGKACHGGAQCFGIVKNPALPGGNQALFEEVLRACD